MPRGYEWKTKYPRTKTKNRFKWSNDRELVNNQVMIHLNKSEHCEGVFTYGRIGGPRSAIDHILVNTKIMECFRGMRIDEDAEELNISDHNLLRS